MIIVGRSAKEILTRPAITKKGRGLQVKKINCNANGVSLKMRRDIRTQEKGPMT